MRAREVEFTHSAPTIGEPRPSSSRRTRRPVSIDVPVRFATSLGVKPGAEQDLDLVPLEQGAHVPHAASLRALAGHRCRHDGDEQKPGHPARSFRLGAAEFPERDAAEFPEPSTVTSWSARRGEGLTPPRSAGVQPSSAVRYVGGEPLPRASKRNASPATSQGK